jgi:hypothetical protein
MQLFQHLLEEPTPFVPMLIATMIDTSCLHAFFKVRVCAGLDVDDIFAVFLCGGLGFI